MAKKPKYFYQGIDRSLVYVPLMTKEFYEDSKCVSEFLIAKNMGKPMILLRQKGFILPIPDLLDGCNIVESFEIDASRPIPPKIVSRIMKLRKKVERSLGIKK